MNWTTWHKWFSLFAGIISALNILLQWLHDWGVGEDEDEE